MQQTIEHIISDDDQLFESAKSYLGDSYQLVDEVAIFYQRFLNMIGASDLNLDGYQSVAYLHCLQGCRYEFLVGIITLLRGHITDSASYLRKAVEFCAFGIEIFNNLDSAQIWFAVGESNRASQKYKDRFKIMKTIRKAAEYAPDLIKEYAYLSEHFIHASFGCVAARATLTKDRRHIFEFHEFGRSEDSYTEMAVFLFLILDLHLSLIKAFQCAISQRETKFDHHAFYELYSPVIRTVALHKSAWLPIINRI